MEKCALEKVFARKSVRSKGPTLEWYSARMVMEAFPRILKECREQQLDEPITRIFRNSLDTGIVPRSWRQANVVPIFKKGDKAESSNYRPISLTSVVGKM